MTEVGPMAVPDTFERRARELLHLLLDHTQFVRAMARFEEFEASCRPCYDDPADGRADGRLSFDDDDDDDGEDDGTGVQALMIIGAPGTGKSGVLRRIRSRPGYESIRGEGDTDVRPVVRITVPDNATPMEVVREIAQKLNTRILKGWTRGQISRHLRDLFRDLGVRHLQMDEAHVFVEDLTPRQVRTSARFLKFLLVSCGVPIVLAGEEPLRDLLDHRALRRRTRAPVLLGPYVWRVASQVEEWMGLAVSFAERLGFEELDVDVELAARLYLDTGGVIGLLAKRMIEAAQLAHSEGVDLERAHFSRAWATWTAPDGEVSADPFGIVAKPPRGPEQDDPYVGDAVALAQLWRSRFGRRANPSGNAKPTRRGGRAVKADRGFGR